MIHRIKKRSTDPYHAVGLSVEVTGEGIHGAVPAVVRCLQLVLHEQLYGWESLGGGRQEGMGGGGGGGGGATKPAPQKHTQQTATTTAFNNL